MKTMDYKKTIRVGLLSVILSLGSLSVFAGTDARSMSINQVPELGLEIWTEAEPVWNTNLTSHQGRPVFIAHSPINYYPPAGMSWAVLRFTLASDELQSIFATALNEARSHYQVALSEVITPTPAHYGPLVGLEAQFSGIANNEKVDVHFFVGAEDNQPTVVMQLFTLPGKLPHLKYQRERSWEQLKYLTK